MRLFRRDFRIIAGALCILILLGANINRRMAPPHGTPPPVGTLPTFAIQNPTGSAIGSTHYISYGQAFTQGAVPSGDGLSLNIDRVGAVATQLDCKRTYTADGSCKHGVITIQAPTMTSSTTPVTGTYSLTAGGGTPVDISTACTNWSETITIAVVSGTTFTEVVCTLLSTALATKSTFTGTISGRTLTTSGVSGPGLVIGQWVEGTGVPFGTMIVSGSGSTWTLNNNLTYNSLSVGPTTMTTATYSTWISGPQATEIRLNVNLVNAFHLVVDLRLHADGSVKTDIQELNDYAYTASGGGAAYALTVQQCAPLGSCSNVVSWANFTFSASTTSGSTTFHYTTSGLNTADYVNGPGLATNTVITDNSNPSAGYTISPAATSTTSGFYTRAGISQHQYQDRHELVWSNSAPPHNIIRDVATFQRVRMVPWIDLQTSFGDALTQFAAFLSNSSSFAGYNNMYQAGGVPYPLSANNLDVNFGSGGGDPGFGYLGAVGSAAAVWMVTQAQAVTSSGTSKVAENYTIGISDGGAHWPRNLYDPAKGYHAQVWDHIGTDWQQCTGLTQCIDVPPITYWLMGTPFPLTHQPETAYIAYLFTGDRYRLDLLNSAVAFSVGYLEEDQRGNNATDDAIVGGKVEPRGQAWSLRETINAGIAAPNGSPSQIYGDFVTKHALAFGASMVGGGGYAGNPINNTTDITRGVWPGVLAYCGNTFSGMSPFSQGYFNFSIAFAVANGYGSDAQTIENYIANWAAEGTVPHTSWNPYFASYDLLPIQDPVSPFPFYHTWAAVSTSSCGLTPGGSGVSFTGGTWGNGNYAEVRAQTLALNISTTTDLTILHDAMWGYSWLLAQNKATGSGYINYATVYAPIGPSGQAFATSSGGIYNQGLFNDPEHQSRIIMQDGSILDSNHLKIDASNSPVTITNTTGGAELIATFGSGADTLIGGATPDILAAHTTGNNTITAGTGSQFMFGPMFIPSGSCSGTNLFRDNTGNNFMRGSVVCGANTFEFGGQSVSNSGQDTIENFRPATDKLKIKSSLDGNSFANAAAFIATCTGAVNAVCALGGGNTITLMGVPASSLSSSNVVIF